MELEFSYDEKNLKVKVVGVLNNSTSADFLAAVSEKVTYGAKVAIDMSEVEYLTSAGLRALLSIIKLLAKNDDLILLNPNESIVGVFVDTGLDRVFNVRN